jgi:short-subunit dehydrogenase
MFSLEDYETVVHEVPAEFDVAIVINNAGYGMPGGVHELRGKEDIQFEITLNALHPVYHSKAWLNRLK